MDIQVVHFPLCLGGAAFSLGRLCRRFLHKAAVSFYCLRIAAVDNFLDDAVNAQVRIATDRGSEVAITVAREAEMAKVLVGVSCFLHGTEHDTVEDRVHGQIFR